LFSQILVKKKNETGEQVQDTEVSLGISSGLDLALNLLFPSLTLTVSGAKLLWHTYLKDTVIGKQISGVRLVEESFVFSKTQREFLVEFS